MKAQNATEDMGGSKTVGSQTASPTHLPTYIVSYWPTTYSSADMEKGKSKKSPDKAGDPQKTKDKEKTKSNHQTERYKDKEMKDEIIPRTESSWAPRQPYASGRAPATSISRPSSAKNSTTETTIPSLASSDSMSVQSQLPTGKATMTLSERRSRAPVGDESGLGPSMTADMGNTHSNGTEATEENKTDKTIMKNSGSKVTISGILPSSKLEEASPNVSIGGKGKVSLSGNSATTSKTSSKLYMSGIFTSPQSKNDASKTTIEGNGKVPLSLTEHDDSSTADRTQTPTLTTSTSNQQPSSSKITISAIIPSSKNKSSPTLSIGTNGIVSSGNKIKHYFENNETLLPTPTPTLSRLSSNTSKDGGKVKISLHFPSSLKKKKEDITPSSAANSLEFKPIQYYTDVPTSPAPSSAPDDRKENGKRLDKKKRKTLSPTAISLTNDPTYFVYPTLSPSYVDPNNNSMLNHPTYSPTYIPTQQTKQHPPWPSFIFGSASGREHNYSMMDSIMPQNSGTFNDTVGENNITSIAFVDITSDDEDDNIEAEEDHKEQSTSLYQKRICPGFPLGINPAMAKVEQEVFFTYGIEIRDNSDLSLAEVVEYLQMRILEDAALNILRCNDHRLHRRRRSMQSGSPVSRVYYSRNTAISTLSECILSIAKPTHCAVVESTIYLSVIRGWQEAARAEVLSLIHRRLEKGYYESSSIEFTHYLGPDLEQLSAYQQLKKNSSSTISSDGSMSTAYHNSFYGAITMVLIVVGTLLGICVVFFRMTRKKREMAVTYQACSNTSTLEQEARDSRDKDHYLSSSSPRCFRGQATPQSNRMMQDTRDLSDSRTLLGTERI